MPNPATGTNNRLPSKVRKSRLPKVSPARRALNQIRNQLRSTAPSYVPSCGANPTPVAALEVDSQTDLPLFRVACNADAAKVATTVLHSNKVDTEQPVVDTRLFMSLNIAPVSGALSAVDLLEPQATGNSAQGAAQHMAVPLTSGDTPPSTVRQKPAKSGSLVDVSVIFHVDVMVDVNNMVDADAMVDVNVVVDKPRPGPTTSRTCPIAVTHPPPAPAKSPETKRAKFNDAAISGVLYNGKVELPSAALHSVASTFERLMNPSDLPTGYELKPPLTANAEREDPP